MNTQVLATIVEAGGRLISSLLQTQTHASPLEKEKVPSFVQEDSKRVTTEETVKYQRRELAKELTLLEGHLLQSCKISGKPCDCCEKHPIKIEGLALETAGMSSDPVYKELAQWAQDISSITTEAAASSGKYEQEYPKLAIQARNFRKAVMDKEVKHEETTTTET
jgi:hypothetical protein